MVSWRKDIKDIQRLQEIVLVFFEEGLGYYIKKIKLGKHLPFHHKLKLSKPVSERQIQAQRLRQAFERLGPTFIKLGQLLSLRPDLVPHEFSKEFEKLQDQVPSFSYSDVKKTIEKDFKKPINKIFPYFEKKPFASASVSQVHKAKLPSGKTVAVKVQRPNIKEIINADLDILFFIASSLEKHHPEIRKYNPLEIVKEFAFWTRRELDFKTEALNAYRLKEEMKKNSKIKVPAIHSKQSSHRILTMDYITGVKIDDFAALKKFHINRKHLVLTYFTSILEQALIYGFFHADPHPANIFIQKNGTLVYLDYGIMGELTSSDRKKIIRFIATLPEKDPDKSFDIIISLAKDTSNARIADFKREALPIIKEVYYESVSQKSFGYALYQVIGKGARYGVIYDANHVLIAKAIYQAEGLAIKLDPKFKIAKGIDIFSEKYLHEKYTPVKMLSAAKHKLLSNKDLLIDLPDHIVKIIERLEEEPNKPHCEAEHISSLENKLFRLYRRKNISIIIGALFLSAALLFRRDKEILLFGIPLGTALLVLAIILLIYFIFSLKKRTGGRI